MKRPAITASQKLEAIKSASQIKCYVCDKWWAIDTIHFDHVQALVDGGSHSIDNIKPICSWCHREKSAFEHSRNSKSKRLAAAKAIHDAVVTKQIVRQAGKIKSRGFDKSRSRKMDGSVVRRG